MPSLLFRGVVIRDWNGKHEDAGQYIQLSMKSDFSDPVRKRMGWTIAEELDSLLPNAKEVLGANYDRITMLLPDALGKLIKLKGSLAVTSVELTPNGDLKKHAMDLACNEIFDFQVHKVKQPNGTFELELYFEMLVRKPGTAKKVEGYLEGVGKHVALMKVGYTQQTKIDEEGEEEGEEAQESLDLGCVLCNNEVPKIDEKTHEGGRPCDAAKEEEEEETVGAVASAREANEGRTPGRSGRRSLKVVN